MCPSNAQAQLRAHSIRSPRRSRRNPKSDRLLQRTLDGSLSLRDRLVGPALRSATSSLRMPDESIEISTNLAQLPSRSCACARTQPAGSRDSCSAHHTRTNTPLQSCCSLLPSNAQAQLRAPPSGYRMDDRDDGGRNTGCSAPARLLQRTLGSDK